MIDNHKIYMKLNIRALVRYFKIENAYKKDGVLKATLFKKIAKLIESEMKPINKDKIFIDIEYPYRPDNYFNVVFNWDEMAFLSNSDYYNVYDFANHYFTDKVIPVVVHFESLIGITNVLTYK